VRVN